MVETFNVKTAPSKFLRTRITSYELKEYLKSYESDKSYAYKLDSVMKDYPCMDPRSPQYASKLAEVLNDRNKNKLRQLVPAELLDAVIADYQANAYEGEFRHVFDSMGGYYVVLERDESNGKPTEYYLEFNGLRYAN